MNFIEELRWRGMIHDIMPGTEEMIKQKMITAYVGIDPTADSLHIGHLVSIMMLRLLQQCGHKPIALIGGATGMIGDPSGKSEERKLLDEESLRYNQNCIKNQLFRFLDFSENMPNKAEIVNNYDWTKNFSLLSFLRDIGKHLTVNYMMAKDSVQKRLETGLSFTEFSYQLLQAYDFLYLFKNYNCLLQMGGSDQWGNITSGTELIRRIAGGEAYALTCPLITKSDGGKFGKTEEGNIWLDPKYTSPYKFYQFWLNTSDADAEKYIKLFTSLTQNEILSIITEHQKAPHNRVLQQRLAKEITILVHSEKDYKIAFDASRLLFSKDLQIEDVSEEVFLTALEGVPTFHFQKSELQKGVDISELLSVKSQVFTSKAECRRMIQGGGLFINRQKVENVNEIINIIRLIKGKFLLIQKGKKNYFLLIGE